MIDERPFSLLNGLDEPSIGDDLGGEPGFDLGDPFASDAANSAVSPREPLLTDTGSRAGIDLEQSNALPDLAQGAEMQDVQTVPGTLIMPTKIEQKLMAAQVMHDVLVGQMPIDAAVEMAFTSFGFEDVFLKHSAVASGQPEAQLKSNHIAVPDRAVDQLLDEGVPPERTELAGRESVQLAGLNGAIASEMITEQVPEMQPPSDLKLARADVVKTEGQEHIAIQPKDKSVPSVKIPFANKGAKGFKYEKKYNSHTYTVPSKLPGKYTVEDLKSISEFLAKRPTPGNSKGASKEGTLNDVGPIPDWGFGQNFVKSFRITSPDPKKYSDIMVNYSEVGHSLNEGFVMRFAELSSEGEMTIRSYGEGNALKQSDALKFDGLFGWRDDADDIWLNVDKKIIDEFLKARKLNSPVRLEKK